MSPMREQLHDKKRKYFTIEEQEQILLGYVQRNKVRKLTSNKRTGRKRKRIETITISSPSSVCSKNEVPRKVKNEMIEANSVEEIHKISCDKVSSRLAGKGNHKKTYKSQYPRKQNLTSTKFNSTNDIKREIKKEDIEDNSVKENKELSSVKISSQHDQGVKKIKREKEVEHFSLVDETVHDLLSSKWSEILRSGLPNEIKDEHSLEYHLTDDYQFLKPPRLNSDLLGGFLHEKYIKSDQHETSKQHRLSFALVAIDRVLTSILNPTENSLSINNIVEILADAGCMLADIHHSASMKRRFDIISAFDLGGVADLSNVERSLFGERFLNILKSTKLLRKPEETKGKKIMNEDDEALKNCQEKADNVIKDSQEKTSNNTENSEEKANNIIKTSEVTQNNSTKNSEEKNLQEKKDMRNSVDKVNNSGKDSSEKINDTLKISEEKVNNDTKVTTSVTKSFPDSEGKVTKESEAKGKMLQESLPAEKTVKESQFEEKIANESQAKGKMVQESRPVEKIAKESQAEEKIAKESQAREKHTMESQSDKTVAKESQCAEKIIMDINEKPKLETAEDVLLNLKNVSVRYIDEIYAVYQKRIDALQSKDIKCKVEIKVAKEHAQDEPFPGVQEALKRTTMAKGHSEAAAKIMLRSLAVSTMKSYEQAIRLWWQFCNKHSINVYEGTIQQVIQFWVEHEPVIASVNTLNTWRSALGEFTIDDLGKSKSIAKYIKGFNNKKIKK